MVFLLRDAIVSSAVQPLLPSLTPHQCMSEHTLQRSRPFPWICWDSCKSLLDREWRVASAYKLSYPSLTKPSQIPVAVSPVGFFRFHSILAQFLGQNLWHRDEQFIHMNEGNNSVTAQRILHSVSSPLMLSVDSCCHPACSVFLWRHLSIFTKVLIAPVPPQLTSTVGCFDKCFSSVASNIKRRYSYDLLLSVPVLSLHFFWTF